MTIRVRLAIFNAVVIAVVTSLLGIAVYAVTAYNLNASIDHELIQRRERFKEMWARYRQAQPPRITGGERDERRMRPREIAILLEEEIAFPRVFLATGEAVSPGASVPFDPVGITGPAGLSTVSYVSALTHVAHPVRVLSVHSTDPQGRTVTIQVAAPLDSVRREIARLGSLLAILIPLGWVVAGFAGWWLTLNALGPVRRLTDAAKNLRKGDPGARLPVVGQDEMAQLAATMNDGLDEIEQSYRKLEQFVADGSHELKSPLTAILLQSSKGSTSAEALQRDMREISRSAIAMKRIVDDLLLMARSGEYGRQNLVSVDLSEIVGEVADDFAASLGDRLAVDTNAHCVLDGDPILLKRMVSNLVQNALVHAGDDALVHVELSSGLGNAVLVVQDDGDGIPKEHVDQVFERFYRADSARSHDSAWAGGGTGLGLAIVKAVVDLHFGSVELRSEPGKGTCVRILLPLKQSDSAA